MPIKDNRWGGTQTYNPKTGRWATKGTKVEPSEKKPRYIQGEQYKKLSQLLKNGDPKARDYLANFLNRSNEENESIFGSIEKENSNSLIQEIVIKLNDINDILNTKNIQNVLSEEDIQDIKYNLSDCVEIIKGNKQEKEKEVETNNLPNDKLNIKE